MNREHIESAAYDDPDPQREESESAFLLWINRVRFPPTSWLNINMMPFIIGAPDSIPPEYASYWPLISACGIEDDENGRVGYLSITETTVAAGKSQRRPGVHTDGHGITGPGWGGWGKGDALSGKRRQGIYIASNLEASCRAWNLRISEPSGAGGSCEGMDLLAPPVYLTANSIYWMTDQTPHESLPLLRSRHRQWFRCVTSPVGVWYAAHSTPNRLGVLPSAPVVADNKFNRAVELDLFGGWRRWPAHPST